MPSKKNQKTPLRETVTTIRKKAGQLNQELLIASDELVENSIATGEKVQDIMVKVVKTGTTIFEKQQDLAFETIESLMNQYKTGNVRLKKLLGFDGTTAASVKKAARKAIIEANNSIDDVLSEAIAEGKETAEKVIKTVKKKTKKAIKNGKATIVTVSDTIEDTLTDAIEDGTEVAEKAVKTAKKAIKNGKATIATVSDTVEDVLTDMVEDGTEVAEKAVKKVKKKAKKATAKVNGTLVNDDLTKIEGIGPKIASILHDAGIQTYEQLARTEVEKVKTILAEAGNRYKMHDPTTWGQQAKWAADGKWDVLKVWQSRLKGGKV